MATIKRTLTLKHRPNTDADVEEITLEEGQEVKLVQAWEQLLLIKDAEGRFLSVPHDAINR